MTALAGPFALRLSDRSELDEAFASSRELGDVRGYHAALRIVARRLRAEIEDPSGAFDTVRHEILCGNDDGAFRELAALIDVEVSR